MPTKFIFYGDMTRILDLEGLGHGQWSQAIEARYPIVLPVMRVWSSSAVTYLLNRSLIIIYSQSSALFVYTKRLLVVEKNY